MAHKKATVEMARRYYVVEGKPLTEIAKIMGIAERTLYNWQRKHKWDNEIADGGSVSLFLNMQKQFMKKVKEAIEKDNLTDPAQADSLWKIMKMMEKLMPEKVMLSNIFNFLEDITKFFSARIGDSEWLGKYQDVLPDLADYLREKYTKEV